MPAEALPAFAARLEEVLATGNTATARLILARLVVRVEINADQSPTVVMRRVYA